MPYKPFNQEITLSYDGNPMTQGGVAMSGTWFNRSTGDSFTVMDSYFEDNNFRVKTTDGRVLDYNTFQDYVQVDPKELNNLKNTFNKNNAAKQSPQPVRESTADQYADLLAEDPLNSVLTRPFSVVAAPAAPAAATPTPAPAKNSNTSLIDKALRHKSIPTMNISFEWDDFPQKQIEALTDVIDVPVDDIVEYVFSETMDAVRGDIQQLLKEYISTKIKSK